MADEIEKKFLLKYIPNPLMINGTRIIQGYMVNQKQMVVRIRLSGENAFLTIKGKTVNASRKEYEYSVPQEDARQMLNLFCEKPFVEKIRYHIEHAGFEWVVDQFSGDNAGLIVAEIELDDIDQTFQKPDWIGKEVTHDPRYYNSNLVKAPFSTWV
ncbi:MAG: CYTH domain-containing protein [Pseudomonadota bacterium]